MGGPVFQPTTGVNREPNSRQLENHVISVHSLPGRADLIAGLQVPSTIQGDSPTNDPSLMPISSRPSQPSPAADKGFSFSLVGKAHAAMYDHNSGLQGQESSSDIRDELYEPRNKVQRIKDSFNGHELKEELVKSVISKYEVDFPKNVEIQVGEDGFFGGSALLNGTNWDGKFLPMNGGDSKLLVNPEYIDDLLSKKSTLYANEIDNKFANKVIDDLQIVNVCVHEYAHERVRNSFNSEGSHDTAKEAGGMMEALLTKPQGEAMAHYEGAKGVEEAFEKVKQQNPEPSGGWGPLENAVTRLQRSIFESYAHKYAPGLSVEELQTEIRTSRYDQSYTTPNMFVRPKALEFANKLGELFPEGKWSGDR